MSGTWTFQCPCRTLVNVTADDPVKARMEAERVGWLFLLVSGHTVGTCSQQCANRELRRTAGRLLPLLQMEKQ